MDLPDFLLARIADDEAAAQSAVRRNRFGDITSYHPYRHQVVEADLPRGCVAVPAPGFLAECDAKRRIVARLGEVEQRLADALEPALRDLYECERNTLGFVLQNLALPYADHPDYDEAWRP